MTIWLKLTFIFLLLLLTKFILSFSINEIIIWNYSNKIYNSILIKTSYVFNFHQSYIAYYNDGNILYKKGNYTEAIEKYNKAISKNPPSKKVCNIRINLSLVIIKNITSNDYKIIYGQLEEAKNNLYNNNCANSIDNSGYSQDAEKLEEEIKNLQDQLNNNSNNKSDNSQNQEKSKNGKDYSDIEEELKKIEREANANRQSNMTIYENMSDYSYYSGKKW